MDGGIDRSIETHEGRVCRLCRWRSTGIYVSVATGAGHLIYIVALCFVRAGHVTDRQIYLVDEFGHRGATVFVSRCCVFFFYFVVGRGKWELAFSFPKQVFFIACMPYPPLPPLSLPPAPLAPEAMWMIVDAGKMTTSLFS